MNRIASQLYNALNGTADPAWCSFGADMSKTGGPMKDTIDTQNPGNNRRQNLFDGNQPSMAELRAQLNQAFLDEDPQEVARLMKSIEAAGGMGLGASDANDENVLDGPKPEIGDPGGTFSAKDLLGPAMDVGDEGEQFAALGADSTDSLAADVRQKGILRKKLRSAVQNHDWSEIAKNQLMLQELGEPANMDDFSAGSTRQALVKQYISAVKENCPGISDEDANFAAIGVTMG